MEYWPIARDKSLLSLVYPLISRSTHKIKKVWTDAMLEQYVSTLTMSIQMEFFAGVL